MSRLSQAISEGDGISVIPLLERDVAALAAHAEEAGAEAVAVRVPAEAQAARAESGLPVLLWDSGDFHSGSAEADAYVVAFHEWVGSDELEQLQARLVENDVDCVIEVRDEDELRGALERLDPEIILVSDRDLDDDDHPLDRVLDLLPDVPAGKLVIAETNVVTCEQVLALERAGVDAVLVQDLTAEPDFSRAVEELAGGSR
jgi:indole-3-glycerol phosphate synthase